MIAAAVLCLSLAVCGGKNPAGVVRTEETKPEDGTCVEFRYDADGNVTEEIHDKK